MNGLGKLARINQPTRGEIWGERLAVLIIFAVAIGVLFL